MSVVVVKANGESKLSVIEASKRLAAFTAVDHHIREEHKAGSITLFPLCTPLNVLLGHRHRLRLNGSVCGGAHTRAGRQAQPRPCLLANRCVDAACRFSEPGPGIREQPWY